MKRQRRVCDVSHPERRPADGSGSPLSYGPRRFPLQCSLVHSVCLYYLLFTIYIVRVIIVWSLDSCT